MEDVARALMATSVWLGACARDLLQRLASAHLPPYLRELAGTPDLRSPAEGDFDDFDDFVDYRIRDTTPRRCGKEPQARGEPS
jgi:hypothetical protein